VAEFTEDLQKRLKMSEIRKGNLLAKLVAWLKMHN